MSADKLTVTITGGEVSNSVLKAVEKVKNQNDVLAGFVNREAHKGNRDAIHTIEEIAAMKKGHIYRRPIF